MIGPCALVVGYIDAGIRYNNLVKQVVAEAGRVFALLRQIDCIVSIGTRQSGSVDCRKPDAFEKLLPKNLIDVLAKKATDAGKIVEEINYEYKNVPGVYYRLDVDCGLQGIFLEE
jgi:hypothetical protein